MQTKKLNIIGCGHVGQTLGRLWQDSGTFTIGGIVNTTLENAKHACHFIGSGEPFPDIKSLPKADITLIATPDNLIEQTCMQLFKADKSSEIIFHCSGALSSNALKTPAPTAIASIHPVKSFSDPANCVKTFKGTACGTEGDEAALNVLIPAFEKIGGRIFSINAEHKTLYHTAAVFICNYLPALTQTGMTLYQEAGLTENEASMVMKPIMEETLENIFNKSPAHALTGPIARGDHVIVERQLAVLQSYNADYAALYALLGLTTTKLSKDKGVASGENLSKISELLKSYQQ